MKIRGSITGVKIFRTVICVVLCFLSLFPFWILFVNSTLPSNQIVTGMKVIPGSIQQFLTNYKGLMVGSEKTSGVTLMQAMGNSLIITIPTVILQVYFSSLTAYAVTV